jgi:hypothetical protein
VDYYFSFAQAIKTDSPSIEIKQLVQGIETRKGLKPGERMLIQQ